MSFLTCCVLDCMVNTKKGVLHKFPHPRVEAERFKRWVDKIGIPVTGLDSMYIYNNRRVCRRHFDPVFHYPKNRLSKLAVPTLCIGVQSQQERPQAIVAHPAQSTLLDITNLSHTGVSTRMKLDFGIKSLPMDISCAQQAIPLMDMASSSRNMYFVNPEVTKATNIVVDAQTMPMVVAIPRKTGYKTVSKKEMELKTSVLKLKADLRKANTLKITFKKRLSLAKKLVYTRDFNILTQKLSKTTKTFLNMQVTQAGKKIKGRRYSLHEKILALSLFKASPRAYRLLSHLFILPKRKTLQGCLQRLNLQPGINVTLMNELKKKVSKLPNSHKFCTVIFDEMSIAPSLTYDKKNEKIIGFVDNGTKREAILADHVLVFMVRGVVKKFKQPIMYSFCAGTTKTLILKAMIKNVIEAVEATKLKVVATICDQGATNVAALNSLLSDTKLNYARNDMEHQEGYFEINGNKIFPIYDPPHLIKGVRNNLLTKHLKYKLNDKECTAKWEHVVNLYNRAPGYRGVRLVPKLTAHHVLPILIPKMRVKHCTQVFSRSVGVALGFMADEGKLPQESKETADLLMLFDDLFDSVNGNFNKVLNGKIYRAAVTRTSPHQKLWKDSLPILKSMRFSRITNGKTTNVPSISSWIKTIKNFQALSLHMHKLGVNSLLLRHFNQDPIENFFGAIRAQGWSNVMPTAAGFQAAYKTVMVNSMISAHSVGANCEKDQSKCLHSLKYLFKEKTLEVSPHQIDVIEEHLFLQSINTDEFLCSESHVDKERCAAIGYCSGWLLKTARKNIYTSCATCKNDLESDEQEDFLKFIKCKEYNGKDWLVYPKREIFDNFTQIENVTNEVLKTMKHNETKIFQYLEMIASIHVRWDFITCKIHRNKLVTYLINKNILFCINNWCKEVNNVLLGKAPLWDQNDPIKVQAHHHHQKYKLRKKVRKTAI